MSDARNILVRGVNWLGDAVMTTPALARLREHLPEARITLLTHHKLADLWEHHPSLNRVLTFKDNEGPLALGRRLRREGFDCGVVFPNSPRSAMELFFARIPRRIGHVRPWRNWCLTDRIPTRADERPMRKRSEAEIRELTAEETASPLKNRYPAKVHHIHQYLNLVASMGASSEPLPPRLAVQDAEIRAVRKAFLNVAPAPASWMGISPGAAYGPAKRWPADRFIDAAARVSQETRCGVLLFGGASDQPITTSIEAGLTSAGVSPVINLAGGTTLRQLCALLSCCGVLLTNDSGPMHLASALETPVVALFGSTSPEMTGPGIPGDPGSNDLMQVPVACSPCFLRECPIDFRCMKRLGVEPVVEALKARLEG